MAQTIQSSNISANNFVDSTSRYVDSEVIYYGDNHLLTFTTYRKKDKNFSSDDKFMIIGKGHEFRPDLVSKRIYGISSYWWKIMEANDIKDIYDFKAGINIRLPGNIY